MQRCDERNVVREEASYNSIEASMLEPPYEVVTEQASWHRAPARAPRGRARRPPSAPSLLRDLRETLFNSVETVASADDPYLH